MKHISWVIIVFVVMTGRSWALLPWVPTDEEFKVLPPYCWAKMKAAEGSPEKVMWRQSLGKDFVHVHHYCAALNFANRYYRERDAQTKRHWYLQAVDNYNYMINQADPGFSLMPDIYYYKGQIQASGKNYPGAQSDLMKSIELNPSTAKSFVLLADVYSELKDAKKALEVVTEGLRHNPNAKSLQKAYKKFGGVLPYPEPYAINKPEPVQDDLNKASSNPKDAAGEKVSNEMKDASSNVSPVTVEEGVKEEKPQITEPSKGGAQTGEPDKNKNPWCRFCP